MDRTCRDLTLFQSTSKRLRDFIAPNHLLIRIDEQMTFAKLMAPLEDCYCPDFGRPAIHPEVMVRALLIGSLYNIASFRRLCSALSENIAYPGLWTNLNCHGAAASGPWGRPEGWASYMGTSW